MLLAAPPPPVAPPPLDLYVAYAEPEHARGGVPARRRRAPRRPRRAARARRALAEGPAQAGRPRRRPLRCDPRRRRDGAQGHGERGAEDGGDRARSCTTSAGACEAAARRTRTATPGRASCAPRDVGATVRVAGWVHRRRDHGGLIFIDLRDRSGLAAARLPPRDRARGARAGRAPALRARPVSAAGEVVRREEGNVNPKLATGEIELAVVEAETLAESATPPFPIDEDSAGRRAAAPAPPRARPAPRRACSDAMVAAPHGQPRDPRLPQRARLPRDRDADPHALDARGRARLPRPLADEPGRASTRCRSRRSCSSSC